MLDYLEFKKSTFTADIFKVEPVGRNKFAFLFKKDGGFEAIPVYLWFDSPRELDGTSCEIREGGFLCNQIWVSELEKLDSGKILKREGDEFFEISGKKIYVVPPEKARFK